MGDVQRAGYFDKVVIKELLSAKGIIVGDIDLDDKEYVANVLIEVNTAGLYLTKEIDNIVMKIKKIESELVRQGFIHDIKFGDLYIGRWRILVHFLNEEEMKEWEENVIRESY